MATPSKFALLPPPPLAHIVEEIRTPTYELVEYDAAPPVLQYNKYVETGYRAHLSTAQAVASMFHIHNETGNIWSHGGALVMFATLFAMGWFSFGFVTPTEFMLWTLQTSSALICFFFSVSYHTFQAHGECSLSSYKAWLGYDLWGIIYAYASSSVRRVWYGLHCYPTLRNICLAATLTASLGVLFTVVTGRLLASPKTRVVIFGSLMFAANLSTIFALYLAAGSPRARALHITAICLQITGGIINAARLPERLLPSSLRRAVTDTWFNSHQLMHILTALSVWCTWEGCNVDWAWALHSHQPCATASPLW